MPERGDIRIELDGRKYKFNGNQWFRICKIANCKTHLGKGCGFLCKRHYLNPKAPLRLEPPKNPKKGDIKVVESGRQRIFNGERWVALCNIEGCSTQAENKLGLCRSHNQNRTDESGETLHCSNCFRFKPNNEFIDVGTQYKMCNDCRNKDREYALIKHQKRREIYYSLKKERGGKCADCGIEDLEVLEFDHSNPSQKLYQVCVAPSIHLMKEEAKKFEMRCRNCHSMKSLYVFEKALQNRRIRTDRNRELVSNEKIKRNGCELCGWFNSDFLSVLEFDHLDRETKLMNISEMVQRTSPVKVIEREMKKCRLLCGNCHLKQTNIQFNRPCRNLVT